MAIKADKMWYIKKEKSFLKISQKNSVLKMKDF